MRRQTAAITGRGELRKLFIYVFIQIKRHGLMCCVFLTPELPTSDVSNQILDVKR